MERQHRLARQMINIAVTKGLEDMKSNARRGLRNLVDMGLLFAKSETHQEFFNAARKVVANPRNPYDFLVKRMMADINNDTIKKVVLNLGYSSLIYGANKLKKSQDHLGFPIPWFLIFDVSQPGPAFFSQMEYLIREGRELGIYSYVVRPREKDDLLALCAIAKRFEECLFVFNVPSGLISQQTAESLGKMHNAVVSIQAADQDFSCAGDVTAFRLLKEKRCLYGIHVSYGEDTMEQVTRPEYIRSAISLGNFFCVYIAADGVSDGCRDAVYAFACGERGENGQPLITLEWSRDLRYISEMILSGDGYAGLNLAEKVYYEYIKAKDAFTDSLFEILQNRQLCTSS